MSEPDDLRTDSPGVRRRPRWRRWLAAVLVTLGTGLLFFVIRHLVRDWMADQELQKAIEEVDRRDPGWRLEELEAKRAPVPDAENAARVVTAAAELLPEKLAEKPVYEDLAAVPPPAQLPEAYTTALRAELKSLEPALREAHKLTGLPRGRYRHVWTDDYVSTWVPYLQRGRDVMTLLGAEATLRSQDGDADGALTSCRALLNAARSAGDDPVIIAQVVRTAGRRAEVRTLERVLAQGQPSEKALAQIQKAVEEETGEALLLPAVRGERAGMHGLMTNLESGKVDIAQLGGSKLGQRLQDQVSGFLARPQFRESHAWMLRYFSDAVDIAKGPVEEQPHRMHKLEATVREAPKIASLLIAAVARVAEMEADSVAELRCAVAGLASERYRQKHGRWPARLDDLVADGLLKTVPADPYAKAPLRLRRAKDGLVIFSVGPEGSYDGTALDAGKYDPNATRLEFRLWDVPRRRQPAPPPKKREPPDEDAP